MDKTILVLYSLHSILRWLHIVHSLRQNLPLYNMTMPSTSPQLSLPPQNVVLASCMTLDGRIFGPYCPLVPLYLSFWCEKLIYFSVILTLDRIFNINQNHRNFFSLTHYGTSFSLQKKKGLIFRLTYKIHLHFLLHFISCKKFSAFIYNVCISSTLIC